MKAAAAIEEAERITLGVRLLHADWQAAARTYQQRYMEAMMAGDTREAMDALQSGLLAERMGELQRLGGLVDLVA